MSEREYLRYEFGPFILDIDAHQLLHGGTPLELEPMEFAALRLLVTNPGRLVSKQEFMDNLWKGVFVEEGRLQQIISALRKNLGDNKGKPTYIVTVTKKGYRFTARVRRLEATDSTAESPIGVVNVTVTELPDGGSEQNLPESHIPMTQVLRQPEEKSPPSNVQLPTAPPKLSLWKTIYLISFRRWILLLVIITLSLLAVFMGPQFARKPEIFAIIPVTPLATIGEQRIVLIGRNFQKGSTVKFIYPVTGSVTLEGKQVQFDTETSLVILTDFNGHWGKHTVEVHSPYGRTSAPFYFEAQKHIQSPIIEAISPESPEATNQEESIVVYGHNFAPEVMIEIIFPNGKSAILQGRQIPQRMPTALTILANFSERPGIYKVRVRNPNGTWCEPFPFVVCARLNRQ